MIFPTITRDAFYLTLLDEFNKQTAMLRQNDVPKGEALELLARHHGLLSPLMDWTTSPYIAAYFAFSESLQCKSENAAIYELDRRHLTYEGYDLITDVDMLRFNQRALHQRAMFFKVSTIERTVEEMLGTAVRKYVLPSSESKVALADLDEMTINGTYLFGDFDSAARTAFILSQK